MGQPEIVGGSAVPSVRNQTRGEAISLLDRVAEIGLLTAYGEGIYGVHPALPWYLEDLFVQSIGPLTSSAGLAAQHAYATAIAELGAYYHNLYEQHGLAETIILLRAEEANLLQAWRIARDNRWCDEVTSAMQGLRTLYTHTGRQIAWARLVHEVAPEFTDPATDRPRSGREEGWRLVTDYRIGLAVKARDWPTARRLQDLLVAWTRQQAGAALAADPATLDIHQRNQIRDLAAALQTLGQLVAEQQQPRCLNVYEEVLALMRRIGDRRGEASTALALGAAYLDLKEARDFDKAEHWYHHSRSLYEEDDQLGQAYCTSLLALVQYRRYLEALAADRPEFERLTYLRAAAAARQEVLALTPGDAVGLLADTHRQLGLIYDAMEDLSRTRHHHQRAIRFYEAGGDLYGAAQSRFGLALALADRERLEEALEWARAALNDFESYGDRAADKVTAAQELIDLIQQVNASDGP